MTTRGINRLAWGAFVSVWALLPFELPIAEGLHGTVRNVVGQGYLLFFIGSLVTVASTLALLTGRLDRQRAVSREIREYLLLSTIFVAIGLYALAVTLFAGAWVGNATKQLLLGHIAPVLACLVLLIVNPEERRRAWLSFYGGFVAFLGISIVFLVISYRSAGTYAPWISHLSLGQRLFMWRYTFSEPWNLYATYVGNANKTSNNILIFLLLSVRLLGVNNVREHGLSRGVLLAFWMLSLVTLLLLFSRATLLLLPLVIAVSGVVPLIRGWAKVTSGVLIIGSAVIAASSYAAAIGYLLTARGVDGQARGFIGSYVSRFIEWDQVAELLKGRPGILLTGLGTSGFSMLFFGDQVAGTHNTFLDTLLESGIGGLILLVALMLLMIARTLDPVHLRVKNPLGFWTIISLILLMTREFSFSYLYATSLGGVCMTTIFLILTEPGYNAVESRVPYFNTFRPAYRMLHRAEDRV